MDTARVALFRVKLMAVATHLGHRHMLETAAAELHWCLSLP